MDRERWQQVRELFERALAVTAGEREDLLMAAAGDDAELRDEVRSLLAAEARAGEFLSRAGAPAAAGDVSPPPARERIGPWRVVREIGRGGMGVVYLGERAGEGFTQRAAIKVVSGAPESAAILRRFRTERRILAALEHPAIARLLDGGTTDDGLPYLAMEYVEGEGLLQYADALRLDLRRRIELSVEICAAVDHAHRRLVLHRDLKPGNILVGADGRPKLLDFGIGKLLADDESPLAEATSTLERWMTPSYAAPEQILGEPTTTATDVHGLGVVLFELLTGLRPFRRRELAPDAPHSAAAEPPRRASATADEGREPTGAARDATAPPSAAARAERRGTTPARLRRQLRGDLDTILAKALEPDPARRYASVADLAADLERHLRGEPILARPAGAARRFAKLVLRHRAASALAASAALATVTMVAYHTRALEQERNVARLEAANASAIATFLTDLFQGANPIETGGATLTARDLLDRGEERIGERSDLDRTVRARLLTTMALARENLGELSRAFELAKRAAELHEAAGSAVEDRVYSRLMVSNLAMKSGAVREAIPLAERAAALAEESPDVSLKTRAKAVMNLGSAYYWTGDEARARAAFERYVEIEKQIGSPARVGAAVNNLGAVLANMGDDEGARALYRESVTWFERSTEKTAYEIYLPLFNLAELDLKAGDLSAAELGYRRGMAAYERIFGPESAEIAWGIASIAEIERRRGELVRARQSIDRALAVYAKVLEPGQADWSWPLQISGKIRIAEGDAAAGIAELERALAIERAQDGDRSDWIGPIEAALEEARGRTTRPAGGSAPVAPAPNRSR